MKKLIFVLLVISCSKQTAEPIRTGCWTGVKDGKRQLIGCYTVAQVVAAEQSQSWALTLDKYTDLKYEANVGCLQCQQRY